MREIAVSEPVQNPEHAGNDVVIRYSRDHLEMNTRKQRRTGLPQQPAVRRHDDTSDSS